MNVKHDGGEGVLVAPEGIYSLTEQHNPPPVLHTIPSAILYPTKIASITVKFPAAKQPYSPGLAQLLGATANKKPVGKDKDDTSHSQSSSETPDDSDHNPPLQTPVQESPATPVLFPGTDRFSGTAAKRKATSRPKHNMRTTSSTFITRIQIAEGMSKTLASKQGDTTFLFYNYSKTFSWVESGAKSKEPLSRISFAAHPSCLDINPSTASHDRMDIVIGFNTGDLIWLDPVCSRYSRFNKLGHITNSPCTAVRWVPSSVNLFIASHADGTIVVYDKEREDGTFTPQDPNMPSPSSSVNSEEWNPLTGIFVTAPPWHPGGPTGVTSPRPESKERDKIVKNPVSHWRVSKRSVVDFVFSPDGKYVAAVAEDGCLRVIDALAEQLVDCYASYFGAFTSVAWSPDGRFVLAGSQDDLLTIFSPWEQRVIARCQGHSSFVSAVAFDDLRCDGRRYRFGSIGEDNKLILWDFSTGALHRPKFQATHHQRMSMSSTLSLAFRRDRSALNLPSSPGFEARVTQKYHPSPSRNEVPIVQPVLVKQFESDMLTSLTFLPRCLLTANKAGVVKQWVRPLALRPRGEAKSQRVARIGLSGD